MDPVTAFTVVGVGYLVIDRSKAVTPENQPENKSVIPTAKKPLAAKQPGNLGNLVQELGGWAGSGIGDYFLTVTQGLNAPITKEIAHTTFSAIGLVGGALIIFVALEFGMLAGGVVGIIVIVVLAICFAVFALAAVKEDTERWNGYVAFKQIVVELASKGFYKQAMFMANEGAKRGTSGLGFFLNPFKATVYYKDSLYYKTAYDTAPKIPGLMPGTIINRGGLKQDYYLPGIIPYEYNTYFGVDGAEMMTTMTGQVINAKLMLQQMYDMQKLCYDQLRKQTIKPGNQTLRGARTADGGRAAGNLEVFTGTEAELIKSHPPPFYDDWVALADEVKDQNGKTLREWIQLHDQFGNFIQPNVPWLDMYLLQSPEFEFRDRKNADGTLTLEAAALRNKNEGIFNRVHLDGRTHTPGANFAYTPVI